MPLLKLRPEFHARPWGRMDLSPLYSRPAGSKDPIGEAWLSSLECRVRPPGSNAAEKTLAQMWTQMTPGERGQGRARGERFPLLVKFIFTAEKLSVQVHPDDAYAAQNEREPWGKTEMWHVVAADPGAWVRVGVKPGIGPEALQLMLGKPEIEGALNHLPVQAGDTIYVPAGTIHAIGPGVCLCEIQQYSDVTYRIFDYDRLGLDGRPRQLHLDKARAAARLETPEAGRVTPTPLGRSGLEGRLLVSSPYFVAEKYAASEGVELPRDPSHFDLLVFCRGGGMLVSRSSTMPYGAGDAFLVLANAPRVEVRPGQPSEFLRLYVSGSRPT